MSFRNRSRLVCSAFAIGSICFSAGGTPAAPATAAEHPFPHAPAWVADQTLYEVNLRQFSAEGNVAGFRKQLPRLQALGVGTLWFMPIHPIGVTGRSGKLGSPYAVKDYLQFNPEFGTLDQFKGTIDEAHRRGMHVIIDWVAPHTALDHPWTRQHPDWYKHDDQGQLTPPVPMWKDVAALNYESMALRGEMIAAMEFWVRDIGVDGFRCDSAEFIPLDFWVQARDAMRKVKPVFMLAEGNKAELLNDAFDAAYAWDLPVNMEAIIKGTKTVPDLINYLKADARVLPGDAFRLNFTSNHDKNAWEGTTQELMGGGVAPFAVLTFTAPGMPLIYNGQETGAERRLNFFEHDPIIWRTDPLADLYSTLARLKRNNFALWDGIAAAPMQFLATGTAKSVLAFKREARGESALVVLNLGAQPATIPTPPGLTGMRVVLGVDAPAAPKGELVLQPWEYRVWSKQD